MTRISQAPGGNSTLVFGDEGPTSPSARGPPASPRAAGTSSTSAPPAPPAVPTAPAQAPTPTPAQDPTPAPTQPVSELEAVKLKVVSAIGQLQTLTPEATELIQGFLEKLPQTGCRTVPVVDADEAMERLRTTLKQRGTHGILSLGKKFKSMDDDGDNKLSFNEFHKALVEMSLPEADVHRLFRHFDADCNGYLSYDEVLVGLCGSLNPRRLDMVQRAFTVLDKSGDGQVTLDDFKGRYDASRHPDVLLGTKTQDQVLTELMEVFEAQGGGTKGDSIITLDEFKKYYEAVSASIDLDDYFELVIRNAWHISGGEGWSANTTCKRVLVLHEDGSQSVQEVQDDLDVSSSQYLPKLKDQGVTNIKSIALYGEPADVPAGKASEQQALGTPPTSPQPATGSGRFSHKKPGGADHFRSSIMFG